MADPFFKWVGSKRSLVPQLKELLPHDYVKRRHVEPFVGSGALFFALEPKTALLADANGALVAAYRGLRTDSERVLRSAQRLLRAHSKERFYRQRDLFNSTRTLIGGPRFVSFAQIARFLYLNKTCFNGIYRENRDGEFNVPIGSYKNPRIDPDEFREAARVLNACGLQLGHQSFQNTFTQVQAGDFVYVDPPYDTTFTSYQAGGFGREQQEELAECVDIATRWRTGVRVMVSGPNTPLIRKLYRHFNTTKVQASRSVNSRGDGRGKVTELVFTNY